MKRPLLAAFALLTLCAAVSRADIYRWEDASGTVHFSDDLSNIPSGYRSKATTIIREAPASPSPAPADKEPPQVRGKASPGAPEYAPPPDMTPVSEESDRDRLSSEVEQLRAKIAAKENLIRTVDERRSLAVNPYRNRIVESADMDLYNKYKAELPGDRQQLQELESRLESLR